MKSSHALFLLLPIIMTMLLVTSNPSLAQTKLTLLKGKMEAADAKTLKHDGKIIKLWGVNLPSYKNTLQKQRARLDLNNIMAAGEVTCFPQSKGTNEIFAQCFNASKKDIAVWMLEQGNLLVDRGLVIGTKFESVYIPAEQLAQQGKVGVWTPEKENNDNQAKVQAQITLMISINILFFLCVLAAIGAVGLIIYRKISDAQEHIEETEARIQKQTSIHEKERRLVAVMLHSELRSNHSKIEAFIVIYDDMFKNLKETHNHHTTLQAGEIVRECPALDRFIFDGNADKMDVLGQRLAEHVISFYANVKTEPDYFNLDAGIDTMDAVKAIESVIQNARNMKRKAEDILEEFDKIGIQSASLIFSDEP